LVYIFSRFGILYQEKSGNPCYIWHRNASALNGMFVLGADQISVRREKKKSLQQKSCLKQLREEGGCLETILRSK
jgi:hypothetical protein